MVAISDLYEDLARRAEKSAQSKGHAPKLYYGDPNAWRTMLTETKPDAVFIATPWDVHAQMAVAAMRAGAHAFVEIPIALTLQEMWQLVDTSEETGRHCMLMENVCYGREELLYLNMVRQGLLGELLHAEAAYIHDLREQMKEVDRGTGSWRTYHYARRNGNLYPCHRLGPVDEFGAKPTGHTVMHKSLVLQGGERDVATLKELVSMPREKDLLFIPHLHYMNIVNPSKGLVTASSRFGALLLKKDGSVVVPFNVRVTQSLPDILGDTIAWMSKSQTVSNVSMSYGARNPTALIVPSFIRVNDLEISHSKSSY